MKKLLVFIFAFVCTATHAAQIVNVEYIHKYINQKHGIEIPYSPELQSPKQAANMKYLLTLVDIANKKLNGFELTTYGTDEKYATHQAVDTTATINAVDNLIRIEYPFHFTPAVTSTTYSFQISAAGTFYINWGDGTAEKIVKTNTNVQTISHTYATAANNYTIGLGGRATEYTTEICSGNGWFAPYVVNFTCPAISFFFGEGPVSNIDGCLGCVFTTLDDGAQPSFAGLFAYYSSIDKIPEELFNGVRGSPIFGMFAYTFYNCKNLTSIPENLFAGISGAPASSMFTSTFNGCRGLTGEIPENLFAGISGAPASDMFGGTFINCSGLTGEIPEKLFAGISGAPAKRMFDGTFSGCSGLTGTIPENLFAGISGAPASDMFNSTFSGCSGLTSIPETLFAGISGAPASDMFYATFSGCSGLTSIPETLFAGISGAPVSNMFRLTFSGCSGLTGYSPKINGKYLYEIWPMTSRQYTYRNCTKLTDYSSIPTNWK